MFVKLLDACLPCVCCGGVPKCQLVPNTPDAIWATGSDVGQSASGKGHRYFSPSKVVLCYAKGVSVEC